MVGAGVKRGPPPSPERLSSERYLQVGKAVGNARFAALQALYEMISSQGNKVFAREHEQDADLQMMPPYVWESTKGLREASEAHAQLPGGNWYFDIHLGIDDATPNRRADGLGPSHGAFSDWFAAKMKASPDRREIKISEDGGELLDKATELGVTFEKFKELKQLAFTLVPSEVAKVWQKPGPQPVPRRSPRGD